MTTDKANDEADFSVVRPPARELIGELVVAAAGVEAGWRALLGTLLGGMSMPLITGLSASEVPVRTRQVAEASGRFSAPDLAALGELKQRSLAAFERRNWYVHGLWIEADGGTYVRFQRGRFEPVRERFPPDDTQRLAIELVDIQLALIHFSVVGTAP